MSGELSHPAIANLLGSFALDALGPEEAALVDTHLRECGQCRVEVDDYRELASMLASDGDDPPPDLWSRIASVMGT